MVDLLASNGFIVVNKEIIKILGLTEAIVLGELCGEYNYWKKQGKLQKNYFYSTRDNIEVNTGLSRYHQRQAISKLVDKEIILEKEIGMPSKKWYSINIKKLNEILFDLDKNNTEDAENQVVKNFNYKSSNDLITCSKKIKQQVVKKLNTNNNNKIIIKNNNKSSYLHQEKKIESEMDLIEKFKRNIEYEIIIQDEDIKEVVKDIVDVVKSVLVSKKNVIRINSELISKEMVKNQFLKMNYGHIQYIYQSIKKNKNDIRNTKTYMLTVIYNSVTTMNLDTVLQVSRIMNTGDKEVDV